MMLVVVTCLGLTSVATAEDGPERRWYYGPPPVTHHHNDHMHDYNETHQHLHDQQHLVRIFSSGEDQSKEVPSGNFDPPSPFSLMSISARV